VNVTVAGVAEKTAVGATTLKTLIRITFTTSAIVDKQESPANAKGTRDSSACMKAHCEQM